ncbi:MAG: phosphatase PAP2 family protein [Chloroflexota bacterium]|nr:phosphatase PAP2 family protein [Chloroflexota bacterium]
MVALGPPWWSAYGRIRIPRRQFAYRLVLAAALVTAAALTNRSFLGWGLFVVFAVLFVPGTRARSFVLSFVPYGAVWFIFTALRSLADETVLARTVNLRAAKFERYLFGGELPTIVLQQRFFDPDTIRWWDFALTAVHWSYFLVPHIVAIRLWHKHPGLFRHYLAAMTLLLAVGLAIYFLIPSNPPWLSGERFNSPAAPTVLRVMQPVAEQLNGGLYQASYRVIGESNPIAAMPSIHMAITFLLIFPARRFGRRWHLLAWAYAAAMGLALVYLGEHYIIDVLVGALVTSYGWYTAGAWSRRLRTLTHPESRPVPSSPSTPPSRPLA